MDVWEVIEKRRTVRAFKGPVPEQLLRRLILAGSRAPSGSNSQPWEFIIINRLAILILFLRTLFKKPISPFLKFTKNTPTSSWPSTIAVFCLNGSIGIIRNLQSG